MRPASHLAIPTPDEHDMTRHPLGLLARASAASLLAITPEYYRVRSARSPKAAKVRAEPSPLTMQTSVVEIDGLEIRYARSPRAGAPTVLWLSPLPQSIHCYTHAWEALEDEADLIAVDLPGFGGSGGGMELMSFAAQSAFLARIIEHFELRDVHIVAPDVAMPVALHYVANCEHAARSVLVGDGPGVLPSDDGSLVRKIVGSSFWRAMVRLNGAQTFLASAIEVGYLHYSPSAEELRDYVSAYTDRIDQVVAYFASYPKGLESLDPQLDTFPLPVQVFWGDTDAFLGSKNAARLHERLPRSALRVFENCGHFCYQDAPEAFTEMVRAWIHGGYARC
jgi:pimeloyl-ACP methyl ester carboxylesterase